MPKKNEITIRTQRHFNAVEVRADTFNEDDRTVEVCWTTGAMVKRYSYSEGYYLEQLQVDNKSIRLDRFDSMSLLDTHEGWSMDSRLGTIVPGSVRIESGKGYALIRLSRKQRAEELLQDLRDGHPLSISVGYKVHRYERIEGEPGALPVLRAIDWEPIELSAVPIPADAGATSRSEPKGEEFETIVVRHEAPNSAAAEQALENPMNKREAAKTFVGVQLAALALGAGIVRKDDETDDALRARLLEAYDIEERAAEEAERRAEQEDELNNTDESAARNESANNGVSEETALELARKATAQERKRIRDINNLARSAGFKDSEDFVRAALEDGTEVQKFRDLLLEKIIARQDKAPTFPHVETRGMQDAQETSRKLVTNALLHRCGIVDKLEEGANEYRSMTTVDIARDLLAQRGESTRGSNVDIIRRSLHTTSDFPIILGDVARETMLAAYTKHENTFELIAHRNVVPDLREVKVLEMGEGPQLEKVNEKGEYKRGTVKESEEGFTMAHYGKVIGLTEAMLINDQLGAFLKMISNWGAVVAELEGDIVWDVIIKNHKLKSDNKQLFHADHGNLASAGTALDQANLELARTAFRKIKDIDNKRINLAPRYLFVGSDLEITAQKLITGVTAPQTTADVVPEAIRSMQPVYEHRLDNIIKKAWFLFAAKEQTFGRGLQYSYLQGYETPRSLERWGFDYDGVEFRLDHYFGAGLTDYRFGYMNPGL